MAKTTSSPKSKAKAKAPRGRPTILDQELIDEICKRVAQGNSLSRVCRADDMPSRYCVVKWLAKGDLNLRDGVRSIHADFVANYARARESQFEANFDEIVDLADDIPEGAWLEDCNGNKYTPEKYAQLKEQCANEGDEAPDVEIKGLTHELIAKVKLQIDARKFAVVKALPKKYGDKVDMTLGGDIKRPLAVDHKQLVKALGKDGAKALFAQLKAAAIKKD